MNSHSELLRNEFYRWEALGRGEKLWAYPVVPEPYFIPFLGHGAFIEERTPLDSGLTPNLFDKARNLFRNKSSSGRYESASYLFEKYEEEETPDALLDIYDNIDPIEFRLLLPEGEKLNQKRFEQLLYSLSGLQYPITFEIIAQAELIALQFAVNENDAKLFQEMFESFFPEIELNISSENELFKDIQTISSYDIISRELALEKEFYFPTKGLQDFDVDPYQAIFARLGSLLDDELAIIQIKYQPVMHAWGESVNRLVQDNQGNPFFPSRPEDLRAVSIKNSKPYFGVNIRLSAIAPSEHRCREILRPVAGTISLFEGDNGYVLASDDDKDDSCQKMLHVAHRWSRRSGMLLNGNELLSFMHLPGPEVHAPKLLRVTPKLRDLPENLLSEDGLHLGISDEGSNSQSIFLSTEERLRHMHVLGASGTGKSTFLAGSIIQDIKAGRGVALLDPHGDLVSQVLEQIPEERLEDVILFDPSDSEFPVGFNMLSATTEAEKNLLASDFVSIIQRLSSSWGDNMTSILGNAVIAFLESPHGGTLLDLRRFLNEAKFRNEYLKSVTEPEVKYFWTHEFPIIKGNAQVSLVTRMGSFIRQKLLRNMVSQQGEKLNFTKMMDEGKIFLAPLAQGLIGEECSFLLGSTLVSKFYQTALTRQEKEAHHRKPFFLYIDEAHNFITPSIASILSSTRKYGLGLTLAHQDLNQFHSQSSSTLSSIITNAHTRVYFKLGDHDARRLEEGFENFEAQHLSKLGRGEAICRVGGSQNDFFLRTSPPASLPNDADYIRESIISSSRSLYGTPRRVVEKELERYYQDPPPAKKTTSKKVASKIAKSEPTAKEENKTKDSDEVSNVTEPPIQRFTPTESEDIRASQSQEDQKTSAKPPSLSPKSIENTRPYEARKIAPTQGRGGPEHKAIQIQIAAQARGMRLPAEIEKELPHGAGKLDVYLEGKTLKIAIEVAHKSPMAQEVKNISKCLPQGFTEIIVTSESKKHLRKVRQSAREANLGPGLDAVKFLTLDELSEYLSELGASLSSSETENLGYTVKTNLISKPEGETQDRTNRINNTIAEARKKLSENPDEKE